MIVFSVAEAPEGGFTARALGFAIFTGAENWEELEKNVRQAVECHFEEGQTPKIMRLR
jgi:hypothetical protein